MGDGTEAYPGDLDDAIETLRNAGYLVYTPRRTPDQRVMDAVAQIKMQTEILRGAVNEGGSFPRPGVISGLRYALSEIPEPVLTTMEREAAND